MCYPKLTQDKVIQINPNQELLQERLLESLASAKSRDSQNNTLLLEAMGCLKKHDLSRSEEEYVSEESRRKRQSEKPEEKESTWKPLLPRKV